MDKETLDYRTGQLNKVKNDDNYASSIKLVGGAEGSTNFMSISLNEFIKIRAILLNESEE